MIAPWKTAKENLALAGESLYAALDVVRIAAVLLSPIMPRKMATLLSALGASAEPTFVAAAVGGTAPGTRLEKPAPLFPRLELPPAT